MDKTIGLIITATVVMVAAVMVVSIGSSSLTDFDDSADSLQDQGCQFQQDRADEDPDFDESDISDDCQENSGG